MRLLQLLVLLITFTFICNSCSKKIVYPDRWQKTELKIDGSSDDWSDSLLFDTKYHLIYTVSNDNKNLYLCIKFMDEKDQFRLLRNGFIVWFDTTGKGRKSCGIKYPVGGHRANPQPTERTDVPQNPKHDIKKAKSRIIKGQIEFEIIGFTLMGLEKNEKVTSNLFTSSGVKIALGLDSNEVMIYELSLPLNYLFKSPATRLKDTLNVLSIGFEGNESSSNGGMHQGNGTRGGMNGGEGGHGGGMYGGGMGGGMNGGSMGGGMHGGGMGGGMHGGGYSGNANSDETKPIKKWFKIRLAGHQ